LYAFLVLISPWNWWNYRQVPERLYGAVIRDNSYITVIW